MNKVAVQIQNGAKNVIRELRIVLARKEPQRSVGKLLEEVGCVAYAVGRSLEETAVLTDPFVVNGTAA